MESEYRKENGQILQMERKRLTDAGALSDSRQPAATEVQLEKYRQLKAYLEGLGSLAVAFSGGVDSTFLLRAAKEALGEAVVAITAEASFVPGSDTEEAGRFCKSEGIRQIFLHADERSIEGFAQNPVNRCYICKKALFTQMLKLAEQEGIAQLAEGSNLDDTGDFRPGMQAVKELGIKSPLLSYNLTKADIRSLSAYLGLPTWNKPSMACLASRFPYGEVINREKLSMVEKGERFLREKGFCQLRVRIHETGSAGEGTVYMARIEVMPEEFGRLTEEKMCRETVKAFAEYGFTYVAVDLAGYRTGNMNRGMD